MLLIVEISLLQPVIDVNYYLFVRLPASFSSSDLKSHTTYRGTQKKRTPKDFLFGWVFFLTQFFFYWFLLNQSLMFTKMISWFSGWTLNGFRYWTFWHIKIKLLIQTWLFDLFVCFFSVNPINIVYIVYMKLISTRVIICAHYFPPVCLDGFCCTVFFSRLLIGKYCFHIEPISKPNIELHRML